VNFSPVPHLPGVNRAQSLVERYHKREITLDECYELLRWLDEVYFRNQEMDPMERFRAALVQAGVNAKRLDLEQQQESP